MDHGRERYWQERWHSAGLARAVRDPSKEKFYAVVAYPGPSGFLHIGHLRGPVLADALHRYHRMRGRAVFFPTGTHATGLPAVTFAQKISNRDPDLLAQLEAQRVPAEEWAALEDPVGAARFLGREYLRVWRRMGLLIDESAYLTTVDEDYQAFIRWQFHRLEERGALRQGPHYASVCPVCGPVSVDASETDLSSGGDAETLQSVLLPFPMEDGRILLAATLRPETVYGATNLWVPQDGELVVWHQEDRSYLVGRAGGSRLVEQHGGHLGHPVPVADVDGRTVRAPLTGTPLPVIRSRLADPDRGTGVVMSVPAHAPADWLALQELPAGRRTAVGVPPVIVEFPPLSELPPSERALLEGDGPPALRAVRATGARSLADVAALEEATERLYRAEFLRGRMRSDILGGVFVGPARDRVTRELWPHEATGRLREFSKPVTCRNGHAVVIRKVPDQWFLRYGEEDWKAETKRSAAAMAIRPSEYGSELSGIFDWYEDRPCTRKGRWLGTPFPKDPSWVIEPIADSTFYPAYFIVRRFVADGRIPVSSLTDAFFDRIFLGAGPGEPTVPEELQREVGEEFRYWYPLDLNIGGKEHKRVHFPVFLYTHAKLLPENLRPRGILVHWWLTDRGGEKISKKRISSKGGAIPPLFEALERWGADPLRLLQLLAASPQQDIEWSEELVDHSLLRLEEIHRLVGEPVDPEGRGPPELDDWLISRTHRLVAEATDAMEGGELRHFAELVYSGMPALARRYLLRGGVRGSALERFLSAFLRMLNPITPHLSEELGEARFPSTVSASAFPRPADFAHAPSAEAAESFLEAVEEDLKGVLKPAMARGERPHAVAFFIASPWKATLERWMREVAARSPGGPPPIRELVDRARSHGEMAEHLGEIAGYVTRTYPMLRQEHTPPAEVDEIAVLRRAEGYLARRNGFERIDIYPESGAAPHDPKGRRERARPGRPAFFLSATRPVASPGSSGASGTGSGAR